MKRGLSPRKSAYPLIPSASYMCLSFPRLQQASGHGPLPLICDQGSETFAVLKQAGAKSIQITRFYSLLFFSFLLLIILSKSSNPLGSEMKSGHGSNDMAVTTPFTRLHSQMETIVFSESEG